MDSELIQAIKSITESISTLAQPRFIDWFAVIISCISVVLSGVAIWFAIQVPRKIAREQKRIALFEKRYNAYSSLLNLYAFSSSIEHTSTEDKSDLSGSRMDIADKVRSYRLCFSTFMSCPLPLEENLVDINRLTQVLTLLKQHEMELYMLPFLFCTNENQKDEMACEISKIFHPLFDFMTEVATFTFNPGDKINLKNCRDFIFEIQNFQKKYADIFERELII